MFARAQRANGVVLPCTVWLAWRSFDFARMTSMDLLRCRIDVRRGIRTIPDDSLPFLDRQRLPGVHIGKLVHLPARPLDLNIVGLAVRAQAERQDQFALRQIARSGAQTLPLLIASGADAHHRANAVSIGLSANQFDAQAMIRSALVMK